VACLDTALTPVGDWYTLRKRTIGIRKIKVIRLTNAGLSLHSGAGGGAAPRA